MKPKTKLTPARDRQLRRAAHRIAMDPWYRDWYMVPPGKAFEQSVLNELRRTEAGSKT